MDLETKLAETQREVVEGDQHFYFFMRVSMSVFVYVVMCMHCVCRTVTEATVF